MPDPAPSLAGRVEHDIRLANGGGIWESTTGYHRLGTVVIGSEPSVTATASAVPNVLIGRQSNSSDSQDFRFGG